MYDPLMSQFTQDNLLLTINHRLTHLIKKQHAQLQAESNQWVWPTLHLFPLPQWIIQTLSTSEMFDCTVLNTHQEYQLIYDLIEQQKHQLPLLPIRQITQLIQQAWHRINLWDISTEQFTPFLNEEIQFFLEIINQFNHLLSTHQWICESQIYHAFMQHNQQAQLNLYRKMILIGFNQPQPPIIDKTFKQLAQQIQLVFFQPKPQQANGYRVGIKDTEDEIKAMANWAKQQLKQHQTGRILCVVPQLKQLRQTVVRLFNETLSDDPTLPSHKKHNRPLFDISAAPHLLEYPIIQIIFELLNINLDQCALQTMQTLFLSPYLIHNEAEFNCCSELITQCQLKETPYYQWTQLGHLLKPLTQTFDTPDLFTRWKAIIQHLHQKKTKRSVYQWKQYINQLIHYSGWPGQRGLTSNDYQIALRFIHLLEEFETLALNNPHISYQKALQRLSYLAQHTEFQPESPSNRLQIMGLLEAEHQPFHSIWMMGCDSEHWPPKPSANPFIPYTIQKFYKLPHSSSERELSYCQQMMQSFQQACQTLIFSYPQQQQDQTLTPSHLLQKYTPYSIQAIPKQLTLKQISSLDSQQDFQGPLFTNDYFPGGTNLLEDQAHCPFKAYAKFRLQLKPSTQPQIGWSAQKKGIMIHALLANIWSMLKTQETLHNTCQHTLDALIEKSIHHYIHTTCWDQQAKSFLSIEKIRLKQLLTQWFALEKQRPYFTVMHHEVNYCVKIKNKKMNIRIDRIDQLTHNKTLIIDYKTGGNYSTQAWFKKPLKQLQLILYAIYTPYQSEAISYAQLKQGQLKFNGLIDQHNEKKYFSNIVSLKHITKDSNWSTWKTTWKHEIDQLADDFIQGMATVTPQFQDSCLYCNFQPLCRIHEVKEQ